MGKLKLNKKQREELRMKFGGFCAYCGYQLTDKFQADHVKPIVRNIDGTCENHHLDTFENLYPSCARCNNYKHSMSVEMFRKSISNALDNRLKNAGFHLLCRFNIIEIKPMPAEILFWFEQVEILKKMQYLKT